MKYAVIKAGGKQYKVQEGDTLLLEKINVEKNKPVELEEVLLFVNDDKAVVGQPVVESAKVMGKVVDHIRGKKINVFKYKAKTGYHKSLGHRQSFTKVLIEKIEG